MIGSTRPQNGFFTTSYLSNLPQSSSFNVFENKDSRQSEKHR